MTYPNESCWVFLIETNQYAGNFERQLCAYLTGHYGECGIGVERVNEDIRKIFEDDVIRFSDEYGCLTPCTMWEDNHNEVGIFFNKKLDHAKMDYLREKSKKFKREGLIIYGFRWLELILEPKEIEHHCGFTDAGLKRITERHGFKI